MEKWKKDCLAEMENQHHVPMTNAEIFSAMTAYIVGGTAIVKGNRVKAVKDRRKNLTRAAALLLRQIELMDEVDE